jgi:hypothetical protein
MSPEQSHRPYDFTHLPEARSVPELSDQTVRALLLDRTVSASGAFATVRVNEALTSKIDLARYIRIATPLDELTVSVSHPFVTDDGNHVADISFRRAHDLVPAGGGGSATFGVKHYEDNFYTTDPPFVGALAKLHFDPPRANKRYLLEYTCFGQSVKCNGSDGSSLQSNGPFAVVLFSSAASVTFTLNSTEYWSFHLCKIRWIHD